MEPDSRIYESSQRAGCEHTDDHSRRGWGTRKHFKVHGRFVALISRRVHGELVFRSVRNELLMHLKIHANQSLSYQQSEKRAPMHALGTMCNKATMRLEMFASPPSHLPVIVCVLQILIDV